MFCNSAHAIEWWKPIPGTSWQIQLQGKISTSYRVQAYDIDLFDVPETTIETLHNQGAKVICYFSAGSFEEWRADADTFPNDLLGAKVKGWAGERWLDIRKLDVLAPIMAARLDLAVKKHCDGVDPDNIDSYTNVSGFPLTAVDQLNYNLWLSQEAHARGLAVGLKNDMNQAAQLVANFDFAVNEECMQFNECDLLLPFITENKPVFNIEYKGNKKKICTAANQFNFDTVIKKRNLKAWQFGCNAISKSSAR